MSTYFLVTTVDADNPEDAVALADRDMDEPTEVPTIDELSDKISLQLSCLVDEARAAKSHDEVNRIVRRRTDRIVEVVTLGNVTAGNNRTTEESAP